jgi:putative FmdB family regulatory protein
MPFYEYECTHCKFYVEALQKISDKPIKQCPSCKKQTMKKLVSAPVFRLKGDGWYETDFKSEDDKKRNLAEREEPAEAKADASKDAKPETKDAKAKDAKLAGKETATSKASASKASASKAKTKPAAKAPAKAKPKPKAKSKPAPKKKK